MKKRTASYLVITCVLGVSFISPLLATERLPVESDFPSAETCKDCHPKQYKEWSVSSHAYSQMSPFMMALGGYFYEKYSGTTRSYCIRCHDPVGTALGFTMKDLLSNKERPLVSREGVTCVVCHRVNRKYGRVNGQFQIIPGPLSEAMYGANEDVLQRVYQGSKIPPHKTAYFESIKGSEMCVVCHEVYTPDGFRFDETYSEWKNSPAAREGTTCQDCHMGRVQGIHKGYDKGPIARVEGLVLPDRKLTDHTMIGPDYSILPLSEFPIKRELWPQWTREEGFGAWVRGIEKKLADKIELSEQDKERWDTYNAMLKESETLLGMAAAKRAELLRNSAEIRVKVPAVVKKGTDPRVSVEVASKFNGHKFPAGLAFERQVWLEVRLVDAKGTALFVSGDLDKNLDLRDNLSMAVRAGESELDRHLFNLQGKFYNRAKYGTDRLVVLPVNEDRDTLPHFIPGAELSASVGRPYVSRFQNKGLPPLATRTARYDIPIPANSDIGEYTLSVKLQFRNFPPIYYISWVPARWFMC